MEKTKKIKLTKNKYAIVDEDDFHLLSKYKWHCDSKGYATRNISKGNDGKRKKLFMHREINKTPKNMLTDHINGNRLDNRKINLRNCNQSQNQANVRLCKTNKSGFKGVFWKEKAKKFVAAISYKNRRYFLGYFEKAEEAAIAYDKKHKELHGEFCFTNKAMAGV